MASIDPEVLTEVPPQLKNLVRYVMRGFYGNEFVVVAEMLMHHPCIKEDDLLERLKFDRKQLRSIINTLKVDHFVKTRLRVETDVVAGKMTKHNYYFVCYNVFVNVVKYKLDHMRRKIDAEERETANRASFLCPCCEKQYTDLEVGLLMDPLDGTLRCTYCQTEVTDDSVGARNGGEGSNDSSKPANNRTLMIKFNEQIEKIFSLLREVEKVKLSASILEPEPLELKHAKGGGQGSGSKSGAGRETWSGEATRHGGIGITSHVTITTEDDQEDSASLKPKPKEAPVWMSHSTVDGSSVNDRMDSSSRNPNNSTNNGSSTSAGGRQASSQDVMKTLLSHEKRSALPNTFSISAAANDDTSDDDDDDDDDEASRDSVRKRGRVDNTYAGMDRFGETSALVEAAAGAERMNDSEDEEEEETVHTVTLGGVQYAYNDITGDMIANMTPAEKEEYIRVGQEIYSLVDY